MKEREAAPLAAACMLLSVALLRMLAPALPFDWMTLALLLAAAAAAVAPSLTGRPPHRRRDVPPCHWPGQTPTPQPLAPQPLAPQAMEALRARMAGADWQAGDGGLFSSLRTLRATNPFAAACAARGLLMMLAAETRVPPEDTATLSLLLSALDALAAAGQNAADPAITGELFGFALRAMGRFNAR